MDLLEALYKKFGSTKEGLEKFFKHAKTLLDDGDITENELKKFIKDNDMETKYTKEEPIAKKTKKKVDSFDDFSGGYCGIPSTRSSGCGIKPSRRGGC